MSKDKDDKPKRTISEAQVSDHAVLRYLERVKGINIQAIRNEILTPNRVQLMAHGCKSIKGNVYELVIKNFTVITVLNTKEDPT